MPGSRSSCGSGAPPASGAAGAAAWVAGAASRAGTSSGDAGSRSLGVAWGCPASGPTGTAASSSLLSSRSAAVSPAHPGKREERERDWRWRWSDIVATLSGACGVPFLSPPSASVVCPGRCRAVPGGAGRGCSPGWSRACGHPPALGRQAGEPFSPRVAPQFPVRGGVQGPGSTGSYGVAGRKNPLN